jgi:hypothetical protein
MSVLFVLLACTGGSPTPPPTAEDARIGFPHAAGYLAGTAHGPEALEHGDTCSGCHRDGSTAPTCASCHEGYPHRSGWLAGALHGEGLTGESGPAARAVCETCHGVVGFLAPSCTSCHASWPHPPGWNEGGAHGAWGLARGSEVAACGSCHGRELQGTNTAPSCASCHADYPHPPDFADADVHPSGDLETCVNCHGGPDVPPLVQAPCSRCHATYPHPADARIAHVADAARVGEVVCLRCHEAGDGRTPIPAGCAETCHGRIR